MSKITYSLNGLYFEPLKAYVSQSYGLIDKPEPKERTNFDWAEYDGISYDLDAQVRYKSKEIELEMFFIGNNWNEIRENFEELTNEFDGDGTQRLLVEPFGFDALVYDVIQNDLIELDKKFWNGKMVGTSTFSLLEINPVKTTLFLDGNNLELSYDSDKITEVVIDQRFPRAFDGNVNINETIPERRVEDDDSSSNNLFSTAGLDKLTFEDGKLWDCDEGPDPVPDPDPTGGSFDDSFDNSFN